MAYLEHTCIEWLEKYVEYSRSTLERKVHPEVSLFQNDSSSQVVCHATGFFPKAVMISWQKNGEDLHEDVELRETLPNQDGTFQKRSVLTVSPEELKKNKYTCVVQHSGLEREMKLQVSVCRVLSDGGSVGIILGVVVAVLQLVLIGCVGVFIWTKKQIMKPGLYYCSTQKEQFMTFRTTTHLQIRDDCRSEFFMLVLVFGAVIVVLLSVLLFLLFIMLKYRGQLREDSKSKVEDEKEDGEMMNYAALHFKKNRRSHRRAEAEDPHVVYSSVGQ
ncbi:hypothetical protein SRHO_G00258310 [Serrasalmus rhombeus]